MWVVNSVEREEDKHGCLPVRVRARAQAAAGARPCACSHPRVCLLSGAKPSGDLSTQHRRERSAPRGPRRRSPCPPPPGSGLIGGAGMGRPMT
jgi:hypothetical protein